MMLHAPNAVIIDVFTPNRNGSTRSAGLSLDLLAAEGGTHVRSVGSHLARSRRTRQLVHFDGTWMGQRSHLVLGAISGATQQCVANRSLALKALLSEAKEMTLARVQV